MLVVNQLLATTIESVGLIKTITLWTKKQSYPILLAGLLSISQKHLKRLIVFVGDQNKEVTNLLESNVSQFWNVFYQKILDLSRIFFSFPLLPF